jgi:DNA-binding NtrC family response regulator
VELPPLRTRPADIDLLARHFAALINERYGFHKTIGDAAAAVLRNHDWPGNVRELQHAVESAMIVCEGLDIQPSHLPAAIRQAVQAGRAASTVQAGDGQPLQTLEQIERAHIETALRATAGHRGQAAKVLGISERNLYRKLREYGLPG